MSEHLEDVGLAGKYLTFRLQQEDYGIPILKVREIIGLMPITRTPRSPAAMRGVINLRGSVIPVVDLQRVFEMGEAEATSRTCIIVVQVEHDGEPITIGVVVDEVSEVVDLKQSEIDPPPTIGTSAAAASFVLGMAKKSQRILTLLNIDGVLSSAHVSGQETVASSAVPIAASAD